MQNLTPSKRLTGLLILSVFWTSALEAVIDIDGFTTATNDRFANNGSFILDGIDLSGVAIADNGRWVTMVSEDVFLSAHHYFPANGTSVTFYASNDAMGSSTTRTIQSSQRIGSSDLRIGVLSSPLSSDYTFYDYATENATSFAQFELIPYTLQAAYILGRSPTVFSISQDIAVGRNLLDTWFGLSDVEGTVDYAVGSKQDDNMSANYVNYEAGLISGDSGAPVLVDNGMGGLTIVGLNWFVTSDETDTYNGYSYLGNFSEQISSFIETGEVPEPASYALIVGWGIFLFVLRRPAR